MTDLERKLRQEIKRQLERCNTDATPNICDMVKDVETYKKVEGDIINMVVNTGITPAAAIGQLEVEYGE